MGARTYSTSWTTVSDFYGYWAGTKKQKVYNLTSPKQAPKYVKKVMLYEFAQNHPKNGFLLVLFMMYIKDILCLKPEEIHERITSCSYYDGRYADL